MKLILRPATATDLETAKSIYGLDQGDLSSAAVLATWPIPSGDTAAAKHRVEWSCQQQKDLVENDSTVRLVKVIDPDHGDEILALGRWHRYTDGYQHINDLEVVGRKDRDDASTWPDGLNRSLYTGLLDPIFSARREWMGTGHYWVLTNIVTREPHRRKGAGSLILKWGLAQAASDGVPAYLEAAAAAKHLYETHGFREVEVVGTDCTPFGMPGVTLHFSRMRADP